MTGRGNGNVTAMRPRIVLLSSFLVLAGLGQVAEAQTVKRNTLTGPIVSKSASMTPHVAAPVYTTPATGFFVLTQLCVTRGSRVTVTGNTMGVVVHSFHGSRGLCNTYRPGLQVPANETLTCTDTSNITNHSCTITGLLSSK